MFDTLLESRRAHQRATPAGALSLAAHVAAISTVALLGAGGAPRSNLVGPPEHATMLALLRFDRPRATPSGSPSLASIAPGRGRRGVRRRLTSATPAKLAAIPQLDLGAIADAVTADVTRYDRELASLAPAPRDFTEPGAATRVLAAISSLAAYGHGAPTFRLPVEMPAVALSSNPRPEYPESLRLAQVEGDVQLQFLVDTTGAPDVRSARVLRSSNDLFTAAVRSVLPRLRFLPAESGGNKVAVIAEQTFSFVISR
ncbi:MAG: energy transducer TonB [Gemmatimonadaceae bacterium]